MHRDKLRTGYGKKKVGFFKNGTISHEKNYEIGAREMWSDMKEWESVDGQTTKYLN